MKPQLKQFGDFKQSDFIDHPVWVHVHTKDYGEEWYEESNEETFRPWNEEFPVGPTGSIILVRTQFVLKDKTEFHGFMTPALGNGPIRKQDQDTAQPHIFLPPDKLISFWGGLFGYSDDAKQMVYTMFNRLPKQIFPIRFKAEPGFVIGRQAGKIEGFYQYQSMKGKKIIIKK